jgi:hypothetical protein
LSVTPRGPQLGERKVPAASVCVFTTSEPCTISSSTTTIVPRPRASGETATWMALIRLAGPSHESSETLRMAPVMTTGPSAGRERSRR